MKKLLVLFVILDFVFVGLILKIFYEKERSIASLDAAPKLSEGQNQKLELIKSFKFTSSKEEIVLSTELLQSLCATYDLIELRFKATNVAFSGQPPFISNSYSCSEISKNSHQETLGTSIADFKSLQKNSSLKKDTSQMKAFGIYTDEEFPNEWVLYEIAISGEISFTITEAELNDILGLDVFKFYLTIF